jgi:hypothetical protein
MSELTVYIQRPCCVEGCHRLGRNKGFYKGKIHYAKKCQFHHKNENGQFVPSWGKPVIKNDHCEECGWNKAPCDRHRINPKLGYTATNVKVLCPNCHRIETIRLEKEKRNQSKINSKTIPK